MTDLNEFLTSQNCVLSFVYEWLRVKKDGVSDSMNISFLFFVNSKLGKF